MDFKQSNDSTAEKGKQNMLLVVLLILVAAFAYLYFFTGLIKPQVAQKPAEPPAPQVVKIPLPPRDEKPAATAPAGISEGAREAGKNAVINPAKPEPRKEAKAETPEKPQKPELAKPSKAAPPEKKSVTPEKKGAAPEAKEPKTAAAAKQQPAAAAKKPAKNNDKVAKAVIKVPSGLSETTKKPAPVALDNEEVNAVPATGKGSWTVVVGSYVLEDAMASDLARVRGAGLETGVREGGHRKTGMNRLQAGEYPTRADAQKELNTLKQYTSDAFILEQAGKFAVYAGSYLLMERADSEKERLAAAGIKLTLKHAEVSIPAKCLTAGTFSDKKAADAAVKKLKGLGFKATLSRL
jgi:hypothetical protein